MQGIHSTLSYDVSGYYIYLPAIFTYKDLKKVGFKQAIHDQYQNSSHPYQTYPYNNGGEVAKYSCGLAVQYLPFFLAAEALAEPLGYARDGYSMPYQAAIHWGSVLVAFLGLFYLRKGLLEYFPDKIVALCMVIILFCTNYLNYVTVDVAMPHNYVFTLTALLIWQSIQFHKKPSYARAVGIGALVGLAALTRPTEILLFLIPVLGFVAWGEPLKQRMSSLWKKKGMLVSAALVCGLIGTWQLIYWKYVGGDWIINSYSEDMNFHWSTPHIWDGLFSYKKGWFLYTPMMLAAWVGVGMMIAKKHPLGWFVAGYMALVMYVAFSWNNWWYGGGLSQRSMVQSYALLAFPLAFFLEWLLKERRRWLPFLGLALFFLYYNVWLHHQAHRGGMLDAENMNRKYFWKIFLKWKKDRDDVKYLDTNEEFKGERQGLTRLFSHDFEGDSSLVGCGLTPINGGRSYCIPLQAGMSGYFSVPLPAGKSGGWARAGGLFRHGHKEWDIWRMPKLMVRLRDGEEILRNRSIRLSRLLEPQETRPLYVDAKVPEGTTHIELLFKTEDSEYPMIADDVYIEWFE
jgi:hypothetical protein